MATLKTGKIDELLGKEAKSLLEHKCKTIDKGMLHLPGPDFVDRSFAQTNRNAGAPQYASPLRKWPISEHRLCEHSPRGPRH